MNALLLAAFLCSQGPCPGGVCPAPVVQNETHYQWKTFSNFPGKAFLYANGVQIGGYFEDGTYRPCDARSKTWGPPGECPVATPGVKAAATDWRTTGVDKNLSNNYPEYTLNGKEVGKKKVFAAITGDGEIPDTSGKLIVSFVDKDRAVAEKRRKEFAALAGDLYHTQAYAPTDEVFKASVPATNPVPTVYVQTLLGAVLLREDNYTNAEALLQEVRKVDPKYDPAKDPKPGGADPFAWLSAKLKLLQARDYLYLAFGGAILFLIIKNNKPQKAVA